MPKLKLISADLERVVDNIEIRISGDCPGISLVNDGHDDLYDLGFTVDGLRQHGLKIVPVEDSHG